MVGWIILGVIAALIVVLLCLRVSAQISFGEELRVTAQIGPVKMQIIPPPEKKTAGEKPKKAAAKAEEAEREEKAGHPPDAGGYPGRAARRVAGDTGRAAPGGKAHQIGRAHV